MHRPPFAEEVPPPNPSRGKANLAAYVSVKPMWPNGQTGYAGASICPWSVEWIYPPGERQNRGQTFQLTIPAVDKEARMIFLYDVAIAVSNSHLSERPGVYGESL